MDIKKDYYLILDTVSTATEAEIRRAYRLLARHLHPDVNPETEAQLRFQDLQEAYEVLGDPDKRKKYDALRIHEGLDRSSALSLRALASHPTLQHLPHEQAYYVRLDITPNAALPTTRLPLNLCLVVDRSTSMQGRRMQRIKEAIRQIIDKLQPQDALSLVVFSDRAEVLLEGQHLTDPAKAKSIISTIQPRGGTEIYQGVEAGLREIARQRSQNSVNHLILLTDGQTYGDEQACLERARWAGANEIQFSTIGIGSDWNEDLLDKMAMLSGGTSIYIDSPEKIQTVFDGTMQNLETIVARNLVMKFNLNPKVRLHEVYQISPQITRLAWQGDRVMLGALSAGQQQSLLLEFRVKELAAGEHRVMRITVEGDMPGQAKHRPWEWVELNTEVTRSPLLNVNIPPLITDALSKLAMFKMQEKVSFDLEVGHVERASQRLKLLATQLLDMGETSLAHAALLEAGQVSRTRALSPEGRKAIRYGTRSLSFVPNQLDPVPV